MIHSDARYTPLHMMLKHIPNILTIIRLILILPFLNFLYYQQYNYAFYIFILAGFTDGLDGWLARYFRWQSRLGSMLDPLADKLLVMASFIAMGLLNLLPLWLVSLVILRDVAICAGVLAWYVFIQRKLDFEPSLLSKFNTSFQLLLITLCLFELAYFEFPGYLIMFVIALTTLTTSASFVDYVWTWGSKAWPQNRQN